MNGKLILWPVLVQISLTLVLFIILGVRKSNAYKLNKVDRERVALHNDAWPDEVLKVSNNIQNQFQTPVLFYVLSITFFITDTVNAAVLTFCWIYAISRIIHSYIHIGTNYVPMRFRVFTIGFITLFALTIILITQLVLH